MIEICRRLDGIPLAIELAAAQVGNLGLRGLLTQLQGSFRLLTQRCQTTLGRHQTLRATLDWSFELLNACEQTCLRRLGVFRGGFTLESAAAVIVGEHIEPREVFGSITQLVAKSLLNVEVGDEEVFYRLLDTTRSYALEKLEQTAELPGTRERHAERCLALMHQAQDDWEQIPTGLWIERYARSLEDIRAALDWGLNCARAAGAGDPPDRDVHAAVAGTVAAQGARRLCAQGPGLARRSARALPAAENDPQAGPGQLLLPRPGRHAPKPSKPSSAPEPWPDTATTWPVSCGRCPGTWRSTSVAATIKWPWNRAEQFDRLGLHGDAVLSLSTHRLRVLALHFAGDQQRARVNAEQVIQRMAHSGHLNRFTHGFGVQYDQSVAALTILARILWMQGQPEQAWRTARQALDIALQINHGTSICYTLALAGCLIAHYNGDTRTARELLRLLLEQAQKHSVLLFYTWARHYAQVIDRAEVACVTSSGCGFDQGHHGHAGQRLGR